MQLAIKNDEWEELHLSDTTVIYPLAGTAQPNSNWYFPLGEFTALLGFNIDIFPEQNEAKGHTISEDRKFRLDIKKCIIETDKLSETYPCERVINFNDEFYIESSFLEHLFPLRLTIDLPNSRVLIKTTEKLPIETQREMMNRAKSPQSGTTTGLNESYPKLSPNPRDLQGFALDEQFRGGIGTTNSLPNSAFYSNTRISGDILGFDSSVSYTVQPSTPSLARINFSRKDPDGNLLGVFKAKEVQIMDLTTPPINLISIGKFGRGLMATSINPIMPSGLNSTEFRGELPEGWTVELYRNDLLLDTQTSGDTRQYYFQNVNLIYGPNRMRLTFYGPQGQRRNEYKTYNIDPSLVSTGGFYYKVAAINDIYSATGLSATPSQTYLIQMGHNLFRSINVNTSFLQTTLAGDTNPSRYYYVNAFSYFPNLFVSGSLAYSQEGGKASELSIQLPVNRLTFGVSYDRFDQFYSEQSLRINPTLYNLSANVFFTTPTNPSLTTSLVVSDKVFENGLTKLIINHTLSNQWKFFYFQNRFTFNRSHDPVANSNLNQWTDVANLRLFYMNNYFELVPTFQQGRMETIQTNLQFQPSFNSQWNAILSLLENTSTHVTQVSITPTYRFSAIRLSNVVSYDTQKNIGLSLLCSTSLATDPEQNTWNFSAIPQSNLGFVTITAFKDKSKSGVFEKDDEPLANVAFNINSTKKTTGPDGTVVFSNLPTYYPIQVSVDLTSIEDPFLRPATEGFQFSVRPGKPERIYFPMTTVGTVEGNTLLKSSKSDESIGKINVPVELIDANGQTQYRTSSTLNGIFSIPGVAPGKYELRVKSSYLLKRKLISQPESISVTIPDSGSIESGNTLTLSSP